MSIVESNIILTQEEIIAAGKFHNIIDRNMRYYHKWWKQTKRGMDTSVNKELNDKVLEQAQNISVNAVKAIGYYGMTILHQLVLHNYYDAVEILLKKGVNPDVRGAEGKGDYTDSYKGVTPLQLSCYNRNYKMAKLLMDYGADTSLCDDKGRNCFHFLASGYYENIYCVYDSVCDEIIEQQIKISKFLKCDINKKDVDGITPLMRLVQNKNKKISMFLVNQYLECGADVMITDNAGNTALMYAVENLHITATEIFVRYPELINVQNNHGDTALHKAFYGSKENAAAGYMLVEAGADIYINNNEGENVADYVGRMEQNYYTEIVDKCIFRRKLSIQDYFEIIRRLASDWWGGPRDDYSSFVHMIARKILRKIDKDDDTELAYAVELMKEFLGRREESCDALQIFYEENFDLCMPICSGSHITTIRDICINEAWCDRHILTKLVELGVDLNKALVGGCTPANIIAGLRIPSGVDDNDRFERIAGLFDFFSRESMEILDNNGKAAIHRASELNSFLIVQKMIDKGVDINLTTDAPSEPGNTPLNLACINQNVNCVKILIEAGADETISNTKQETPAHSLFYDYYRNFDGYKCYEIMTMLNNIDTANAYTGETPLMILLKKSPFNVNELTRLLLSKGADVNRADKKGNTPLLIHAKVIVIRI